MAISRGPASAARARSPSAAVLCMMLLMAAASDSTTPASGAVEDSAVASPWRGGEGRFVLVSAASSNHYVSMMNMVASARETFRGPIVVWDLGLTVEEVEDMLQHDLPDVELRTFNFSAYPDHVLPPSGASSRTPCANPSVPAAPRALTLLLGAQRPVRPNTHMPGSLSSCLTCCRRQRRYVACARLRPLACALACCRKRGQVRRVRLCVSTRVLCSLHAHTHAHPPERTQRHAQAASSLGLPRDALATHLRWAKAFDTALN